MTNVATVYDHERGCGWRREGVYLVSANNSTDGIGLGGDAAGLIEINPPIPVHPRFGNRRGFVYVDGDAILGADPHGQPVGGLGTPPLAIGTDMAEARSFSWRTFGLDYPDRADRGYCTGLHDVRHVLARLTALLWTDKARFGEWVRAIARDVDAARNRAGDLTLAPLIVAVAQARSIAELAINGNVMTGPPAALGAAWRVLHTAQWCDGRFIDCSNIRPSVAGRLIPATGAIADAPYALRFAPPVYRVPPDVFDWIGRKFYDTSDDFKAEAKEYGVSRRMSGVPKGIVPAYSRSFLAHERCKLANGAIGPGIFGYYIIAQMQYVLPDRAGDSTVPPWLLAYGVQPVKVVRVEAEEG